MSKRTTALIVALVTFAVTAVTFIGCFWKPEITLKLPSPFATTSTTSNHATTRPTSFTQLIPQHPPDSIRFEIDLDWTTTTSNPHPDQTRGTIRIEGTARIR